MSTELDDFYATVEARNADLKKRSAIVQDIFAETEKTNATIIANQQTIGNSTQIVTAAKEIAGLQAQNNVQAMATKLGINPEGSSEVLDKIADEWKASKLDSIEKRKQLKDALEVNFFEHPVDYVTAQIKMENTVRQAEAAAARNQGAAKDFSDIQSLTQNLPGQMAALAKTKSDVTIQATLEGVRAETDNVIAKQKVENAGVQVRGLQMLNSMSAEQLQNMNTGLSMRSQQEQLAQSREAFKMQKAQFAAQQEERIERINQKKADAQELEGTADTIRKGAAVMGFQDVTAFPTKKIMNMLSMRDGKIMDFFKAGMATEATGHPIIADTPGEVARMLADHTAPLRPEQKVMKGFFSEVWRTAATPEAGLQGKYDPTKKDQVVGGATGLALTMARKQMDNIKDGDNTNIYSPPPLATVLEIGPVKNSAWAKAVMAPQMVTGALVETKPDQLIELTTAAVKAGKISFNDASAGLLTFFSASKEVNNKTRNYIGMGLPPQEGFNTTLANGFGQGKKINLVDPKAINTLLTGRMSRFGSAVKANVDFENGSVFSGTN